jgi:hypothetical protein
MPYFSRGLVHETVVQNGRVIRDVGADSYSQGDKKHNNFVIKGHDNNTPFLITNMKNLAKGTRRFRTPTPYYPRRRKTGKKKNGKKKSRRSQSNR